MKRFVHLYFAIALGIVLGLGAVYFSFPRAASQTAGDNGVAGAPIGGPLTGLVDQNGKTVDAVRFAGKTEMVFFGFTHCPVVCPTNLQQMTVMLKKLTPQERAKLAVIFVSVDPERDTPQVLKDYLAMFNPAITGLTGTPAQIEKIKAQWGVYSAKVDTGGGDYTVDHSAYTYLRGPDGKLLALFANNDAAGMTAKVKDSLR